MKKASQAMLNTFKSRSARLEQEIPNVKDKDRAAAMTARKNAMDAMLAAPARKTLEFSIGDSVDVSVRIVEGEKERLQVFSGVVIGRRGDDAHEMFTVRRIVNNEGVERTFPVNSPKIASVGVIRGGRNRRAKLYYLRDRVGKAVRLKERRVDTGKREKEKEAAESSGGSQG